MEIVLVRHGQPEWIRDGLNVVDPPLTDLGRRQADAMAETLSGEEPFDEVFCSPLVRARQTAAPLFDALGRTETVAPWLEEIRDPSWHGTPQEKAQAAYDELRARPAVDRWEGLVDGESIRDFTSRIHSGADEFFGERGMIRSEVELPIWQIAEPGARIALIAHAGTNATTIAHLLGLTPTPWEWDRFILHHASISRLTALELADGFTFALSALSDVEHLDAEQRTR
ncbi:MAG: histidine phosphatase family protein [Actinomycetota bacterium]